MSSIEELEKLTVSQIKEKLKANNLSTTGTKAVLIKRLIEHNEESLLKDDEDVPLARESADLDEELLNDESVKDCKGDNGLVETSMDNTKVKDQEEEKKLETKSETLKRKINVENFVELDEERKAKLKRAERFNLPAENVLTDAEKKKLREERFKDSLDNAEEKLKERAKRFGIPEVTTTKTTNIKGKKLIKFGGDVDKDDEKLAARAKRFGITNTVDEIEEKKRKRMERFGETKA
uniref:SAP domain-containing protein n=1 Tax=Parastrongyloides trichosuri TaxID=131310 RepID=A0A0N4ZUQ1_PARTI